MKDNGLLTKTNQEALLDAGLKIDSSARVNYNKNGEWHVLIYPENTPRERVTIWLTKTHIRIYAGINTPIFRYFPDDPKNKYPDKERRITFYSMDEALDFINQRLVKNQFSKKSINTPIAPKDISLDGFVVVCPRCKGKFQRAERCPECGQLILY